MTRLKDLEDQTEQHSRVQEKMKERLKMMDDHAQSQGQQVSNKNIKVSSLESVKTFNEREWVKLRNFGY